MIILNCKAKLKSFPSLSPQPDTSVHCQITDTGLVHRVVCPLTLQLSLVLIVPMQGGMARLSWPEQITKIKIPASCACSWCQFFTCDTSIYTPVSSTHYTPVCVGVLTCVCECNCYSYLCLVHVLHIMQVKPQFFGFLHFLAIHLQQGVVALVQLLITTNHTTSKPSTDQETSFLTK